MCATAACLQETSKKFFFHFGIYLIVCMCGCFAYMHVFAYYVCAGLTGARKSVSEPLELESEAVVSRHVCAGDLPQSSGRGLTH